MWRKANPIISALIRGIWRSGYRASSIDPSDARGHLGLAGFIDRQARNPAPYPVAFHSRIRGAGRTAMREHPGFEATNIIRQLSKTAQTAPGIGLILGLCEHSCVSAGNDRRMTGGVVSVAHKGPTLNLATGDRRDPCTRIPVGASRTNATPFPSHALPGCRPEIPLRGSPACSSSLISIVRVATGSSANPLLNLR